MKLYFSRGACSLSVRIVIHEIGVTCAFESVDLKTKKTESGGDYYQINPKGAVPALMINEKEVLTENVAIHQYLADTNEATQLLPAVGNFKRYRVIEALSFVSSDVHKGFGPLFNPNVPQEMKDKIFIPLLKAKLEYIEKHLSNKKFLTGDVFTLPDAYLFVMLLWLHKFQIDLKQWPHLEKYFDALKERESIKQSLKEEGLLK